MDFTVHPTLKCALTLVHPCHTPISSPKAATIASIETLKIEDEGRKYGLIMFHYILTMTSLTNDRLISFHTLILFDDRYFGAITISHHHHCCLDPIYFFAHLELLENLQERPRIGLLYDVGQR
jgi:hypothetical protein